MDDDFSGFADERLFIIVGCMCRLRSFDMSNSDSDASTSASITDNAYTPIRMKMLRSRYLR